MTIERLTSGYRVHETDIPELIVRIWASGCFQLVDNWREVSSPVVSYEGIATIEMPEYMKCKDTGRGSFAFATEYWEGILPVKTLFRIY